MKYALNLMEARAAVNHG